LTKLFQALASFLKSNSVVGAGVSTLVVKVASAGLSYLMFVLIANVLSPEEYGMFGVGFAIAITLGNVAALGTSTSLLRFLPQYSASGRKDLAKGYLLSTSKAVFVFAIVVGLLIAAVGYFMLRSKGATNTSYLFAAAIFTCAVTFNDYLSHALRAIGHVLLSQVPKDVIWRLLICLIAAFYILSGHDQTATHIIVACLVTLIAVSLVQLVMARNTLRAAISGITPAYDKPTWISTMLPIWGVVSLVAMVQQFDVVVVGLIGPASESGSYFAALRTASLLSLMLLAGNLAAAPLMSSLYHTNDRAGLHRMVRLISAGIGIPTLLGLGSMAVLGGWLLRLFDESFAAAYPVLMVLACGYAADALAGPTAYLLQMTGHEKTYLKILASCYGLTVILQVIFIPIYGLMGAAVPSALGMGLAGMLGVISTRRHLGIDPSILGAFTQRGHGPK
jgi:O-antigen/teichoic acid export membrane protein